MYRLAYLAALWGGFFYSHTLLQVVVILQWFFAVIWILALFSKELRKGLADKPLWTYLLRMLLVGSLIYMGYVWLPVVWIVALGLTTSVAKVAKDEQQLHDQV